MAGFSGGIDDEKAEDTVVRFETALREGGGGFRGHWLGIRRKVR